MTEYTLAVQNNSSNYVDFCVFQTAPDLGLGIAVRTLAWFAEPAYPTTNVVFQWNTSYSFVWSNAGPLSPGVVFQASQTWDADPMTPALQGVQLTYAAGAYNFQREPASNDHYAGNLYIDEGGDVPLNDASVGIGMSGSGTYAVDAQPNQHLVFTPHPKYWLVAGNFDQGQVIDLAELNNPVAVEFYGAQTKKSYELTMDNTFQPMLLSA